jgi:NAD(P)-dependent dehydrogenase (short-subunit alcohol dehydrogenase family)
MLEGTTAFVTGGARGIGLGIARAVAARGASVALADRDPVALEAARHELGAATVRTYQLDVADRQRFLAVAEEVENDLGPVHALFNNAGVIDSVSPSRMRGEVWDWMVGVNLHGVYNGIQAFVPRMIARREGGLVVNVSSMAGLVTTGSGFAYHATKYAVVGLSESLRAELAHHRISVSLACPGVVATHIVRNAEAARPAGAEARTDRARAILDAAHETMLGRGVDPDAVGADLVRAALAGQPYIFTDGLFRDHLTERHRSILGCMPSGGSPALEDALAHGADSAAPPSPEGAPCT